MANTFRKIYKKTGNSGSGSDYELVGNVGVDGVELDIMKGASSSTDGELGLVPKPTKDDYNFVLKANGIWDCIYPVGSIYLSVININPSEYFGGTWVSWGSGRVPVGVNSSDSSFNTVEKTGGSKTHSHTITVNNKAAFTSGSTSLKAAQLPNVRGNIVVHNYAETSDIQAVSGCFSNTYTSPKYTNEQSLATSGETAVGRITFDNGGKGQSHTHSIPAHNHTASSNSPTALPPYITCYMWKRTA